MVVHITLFKHPKTPRILIALEQASDCQAIVLEKTFQKTSYTSDIQINLVMK